jgi:hypothetical protein
MPNSAIPSAVGPTPGDLTALFVALAPFIPFFFAILVAIMVVVFREAIAALIRRALGKPPEAKVDKALTTPAVALDQVARAMVLVMKPMNDKLCDVQRNHDLLESRVAELEVGNEERDAVIDKLFVLCEHAISKLPACDQPSFTDEVSDIKAKRPRRRFVDTAAA